MQTDHLNIDPDERFRSPVRKHTEGVSTTSNPPLRPHGVTDPEPIPAADVVPAPIAPTE